MILHFQTSRTTEVIYSQILAAFFSDGLMYVITLLLMKSVPPPLPFLAVFVTQIVISIVWTFLTHKWYFKTHEPKKTIIVYDMRHGMEIPNRPVNNAAEKGYVAQ